MDFDPGTAQAVDFDPDSAQPVRKVGVIESALRTAGESARKAVGMFDMAAAGMAKIFGSEEDVKQTLDIRQARQEGMRDMYAQKPDEEFSGVGSLAGGVASAPIEVAGGFGLQHGVERAADVLDRGGSMQEAGTAGAVSGGVHGAMNLLPVKAGGAVGRVVEGRIGAALGGAATGAAVAAGAGAAGRAAENAALPAGDQFKDLNQEVGGTRELLTDAGMGAAFGAVPGAHASVKKAKAKRDATPPPFPADKMAKGEGDTFVAPNGSQVTKEMWDGASQRVRDGWMVEQEKVPAGETTELKGTLPDNERLAEIERLKENTQSEGARAALDEEASKLAKKVEAKALREKAMADAVELRRMAGETADPELQKALRTRADKLEAADKVPAGQVKEGAPDIKDEAPKKALPVGEVKEGAPEIKADVPTEPLPTPEVHETPAGAEHAPEFDENIPAPEVKTLYEDPARGEAADAVVTRELPKGEATEVLPTPDVIETPAKIPAGEAHEMLPTPEVHEVAKKIPVGEAKEVTGAGVEPAPDKIPAGEAKPLYEDPKRGEKLHDLEFPSIDSTLLKESERAAPAPDEQGRRHARATLEKGAADGTLNKDGAALALWALDKNPNLAAGLRVKVRKGGEEGVRGSYDTANRIVELFTGEDDAHTAAHEILHHSERMMPPEVQRGIRREWRRHLAAEGKGGSPERQRALADIPAAALGDNAAKKRVLKAFQEKVLDGKKDYHLYDPSEFFAVNAARILGERHAGRNSWRLAAIRWVKDMVEHVKGTVGVRSDSPVIKALDKVLDAQKTKGVDEGASSLRKSEKLDAIADKSFDADLGAGAPRKLDDETRTEAGIRKLFDRFNRVAKLQKTEAPKSEDADIVGADTLYTGRAQHRGDELERTVIKPLGKALDAAKKAGLTVRDADDYLMALHAPERNAVIAGRNPKMQDGGSGLTNAQAKAIVDGFTPAQRTHLDAVAKIVHDMNRAKLDAMVDDGLIEAKTRDTLNQQYKKYVPLKTLDEEDAFTGIGRGYEMRANDITTAMGRSSKASSPIAASVMDASRAIMRGEKARVDQAIWKYAQDPAAHDFIKPYDEKNVPKELLGRKIGPDGKVKDIVDSQKVQDLTVSLVIDGKQQRVFVPDQLLRDQLRKVATANDPGPVLAAIGRGTGTVGRMLTEFNPAFTIPNAVKDAITVGIRAGAHDVSRAKVVAGIPSAWKAIVNHKRGAGTPDAKLYEEFLKTGGKTGAYGIQQLSDTMRHLEKAGAKLGYEDQAGGAGRRVKNALGDVAKVVSNANEVMEYASRFALYKEMRAKGATPKTAARAAKEVTVNFNRSGEYGRTLNSVLVFANAALQGLRNTGVYAMHPTVRRGMLAMVALGAATQAYNEMVGGENDETGEPNINSQNDAVADKNMVILSPGSRSGIKIPLPPEYAVLSTIGRRLWRAASQGNISREAAGIAGGVLDATLPVRLPDADSSALAVGKAVVPTLASPFADLWTKQNYFGQPIVPEQAGDSSPAPYYTKSRTSTSDIAKGLSQLANAATGGDSVTPGLSQKVLGPIVAPEGIEHIVGFFTGGMGQLAMQSKNIADSAVKGKPLDTNKLPIANRFAFEEPKSYTSRRYKELAPQFEYARDYQKAGTPEKIDPKVARALPEFEAAERELRGLFKELRAAGAAGDDAEPIQARIKAAQARVIKTYNGQTP